jgi:hypothetical protein
METAIRDVRKKRKKTIKENEERKDNEKADIEIGETHEATWQRPHEKDPKPGSAVIVEGIILFAHT